jgi:phosphoglycerate dehydrogenase-like enzyme
VAGPNLPLVLVTFPAPPELRSVFEEVLGDVARLAYLPELDEPDHTSALDEAKALLAWNLSRELGSPPALGSARFVQLLSAGADQVPFEELPPGVTVAGNVGAYAEPMAEHALAMAIALAKRLPQKHREMAGGEFPQRPGTKRMEGSVCGILGFGGIGKATARLFRAVGARIHAVNTSGRTDESVEFVGTLEDLGRVLEASDVVVIALPLTRATKGLIGREELARMKPDAVLVNVARGAIMDQQALYEHLRDNPDFSAGIDAWWTEPFAHGEFRTDFPFFDLPNLLGSPHVSAIVPGIEAVSARRAAENVRRLLAGEPVAGRMRPEDYRWD